MVVSSEDMADKMAIQHATFKLGGRKIELKKSVPTNPGNIFCWFICPNRECSGHKLNSDHF